mgnify:CR=1 FL=1
MDKLGQEWVSAAVDGELDEQTLAELAADADSHEQWRDYHMIGDAMRGELPQTVAIDLSASIMAAIDEEPAIIAPKQPAVKPAVKPLRVKLCRYLTNLANTLSLPQWLWLQWLVCKTTIKRRCWIIPLYRY